MKWIAASFLLFFQVFGGLTLTRTGLGLEMGPGYRQEKIRWKALAEGQKDQEVYPALRMFDWIAQLDASLAGVHLKVEGDMGWFSSQVLRKSLLVDSVTPTFSCVANGRLATVDARIGYQFDVIQTAQFGKCSLVPTLGWLYDVTEIHRNHPIPPIVDSISIEFLSNLHQRWDGPTLGLELFWQPTRRVSFDGSYIFGWLGFNQTYAQEAGSITTSAASISNAKAVGQALTLQMSALLSSSWFLSLSFRYLYLHTDVCHVDAEQNSSAEILRAEASDRSLMGSALLGWSF